MVLSLLYPNLRFGQVKFHQDHIHPDSIFKNSELLKQEIPKERWNDWQEMKDKLPNLQLMEGKENESKNKTPFKEWLNSKNSDGIANVPDINKFKMDNYLPDVSLDFKAFEDFYKSRKNLLKLELKKVLQ